jgi:hypothetical protein
MRGELWAFMLKLQYREEREAYQFDQPRRKVAAKKRRRRSITPEMVGSIGGNRTAASAAHR